MTYTITDPAVAQAIGLCWLARRDGLPEISVLRSAVAQLHQTPCSWCDFPPEHLIRLLEDHEIPEAEETAFWRMPGQARLKLINRAADRESAA